VTDAPLESARLSHVVVVGAGLMGASVGLALRARGVRVHLVDRDPAAAALAEALGAGQAGAPSGDEPGPQLVVLAVPPASVGASLIEQQRLYLQATFTDLASVKAGPQAEIERLGADLARFVGGHPLAGRERSGAGAAQGDLFEGRPWVLTPSEATSPAALRNAEELVRLCAAQPVTMTPDRHDEAVALVSHVPQLVASLTAARLAEADADLVALSGQGIRDVTRIAASDPALWTDILAANASSVLAVLDALSEDLTDLRQSLRLLDESTSLQMDKSLSLPVSELLERGNVGYHRIPGKHGAAPATYTMVRVVVADSPGELARLLVASGAAGVNVEDVSIEHSSGQAVGLVELAVRPAVAEGLADALRAGGWSVHG
jgi:prephenate dehydrogenase